VFFVRADLVGDLFPNHLLGLRHYVPLQYRRGYGHPIRDRYSVAFYKRFLTKNQSIGSQKYPYLPHLPYSENLLQAPPDRQLLVFKESFICGV
jgi:hypothetical protein